jgi:NADH:ubiquinone oxidoreductase subunit K
VPLHLPLLLQQRHLVPALQQATVHLALLLLLLHLELLLHPALLHLVVLQARHQQVQNLLLLLLLLLQEVQGVALVLPLSQSMFLLLLLPQKM